MIRPASENDIVRYLGRAIDRARNLAEQAVRF
jgi:hypothetical protein